MLLPQQGGQGVPAAREGLSETERGAGEGGGHGPSQPLILALWLVPDCLTVQRWVFMKSLKLPRGRQGTPRASGPHPMAGHPPRPGFCAEPHAQALLPQPLTAPQPREPRAPLPSLARPRGQRRPAAIRAPDTRSRSWAGGLQWVCSAPLYLRSPSGGERAAHPV